MFPFAKAWPAWVRSAITDFVETAVAALLALNLVFPGTLSDAKQEVVVVGFAVLAAVVAAARRSAPGFFAWVEAGFGSTPPAK